MLTIKFFMNLTVYYDCGGTMSATKNFTDYAPATPKIPL